MFGILNSFFQNSIRKQNVWLITKQLGQGWLIRMVVYLEVSVWRFIFFPRFKQTNRFESPTSQSMKTLSARADVVYVKI